MVRWLGSYLVTLFWNWFSLTIAAVGLLRVAAWFLGKTLIGSSRANLLLALVVVFIAQASAYRTLEDELKAFRAVPVPELTIYYDGKPLNHRRLTIEAEEIKGTPFANFLLGPFEIREGGKSKVQSAVARLYFAPKEIYHYSGAGWSLERSDDDRYQTAMRLNLGAILRGDKLTIYRSQMQGKEMLPEFDAALEVNSDPQANAIATFKIILTKKAIR